MSVLVYAYLAYLVVGTAVTVWVARTLRHNGSILVTTGTDRSEQFASAVADLLIMGFYLLNFGMICFLLRADQSVVSLEEGIELLSRKVGIVLVSLAVVHFLTLALLGMARGAPSITDSDADYRPSGSR